MATHDAKNPIEILLIEDNLGDIELTKEAFKEGKLVNNLHVARDGEEALQYLYKKGPFANAARPDLILLDLNLPKKDGRELLDTIKQDPILRIIPVVILTSSEEDRDVIMSYILHVNCYIVKPVDFDKFTEVVRTIETFWLQIVRLP
jgi:two-component system, chemotaxis family, response regulator Rcp1